MIATEDTDLHAFVQLLNQLCKKSAKHYQLTENHLDWSEQISELCYWMSPGLLSIYGTEWMETLDQKTLFNLSRWESIHFYSLNVEGIRSLLSDIILRIHTPGFDLISEFLHHFIAEENEHMRFFSKFCLHYGKKIYPNRTKTLAQSTFNNNKIDNFLLFARIVLFEELVDFYNLTLANDTSLPTIVQNINQLHHQDEARHIAFGRKIVRTLFEQLKPTLLAAERKTLDIYLKQYLLHCLDQFYNPSVYQDCGIKEPYALRMQLIHHPQRHVIQRTILKKILHFLLQTDILQNDTLPLRKVA